MDFEMTFITANINKLDEMQTIDVYQYIIGCDLSFTQTSNGAYILYGELSPRVIKWVFDYVNHALFAKAISQHIGQSKICYGI